MIAMQAVVTGHVQGVRYRVFVQDAATQLGLVGSVQNIADGSVQVVAEGSPDTLKEFVEYLHEGSLQARVDSVAIDWCSAADRYDEFSVIQ